MKDKDFKRLLKSINQAKEIRKGRSDYKITINCRCGTRIITNEIKDEYACICCGAIYEKKHIDREGNYAFYTKGELK